jgi:trimethyllysine dioxygenase
LWDAKSGIQIPRFNFQNVIKSDLDLAYWLKSLEKYGFSVVEGVPINKEDTERLARRIAFIRETHYGSFWEFKADMKHNDTAYTTLGIGCHTDTTYFTDPIGLQMLHLLEFNGKGGKNIFVDGFKVAEEMRRLYPTAFNILSKTLVPHHYIEKGVIMKPEDAPIIRLDPRTGKLVQIRYNNTDRDVIRNLTSGQVRDFYTSLKIFHHAATNPENELSLQMEPGKAIFFNNWRVLHARLAFTGHRHVCGCYINYDDYKSRLRTLLPLIKK